MVRTVLQFGMAGRGVAVIVWWAGAVLQINQSSGYKFQGIQAILTVFSIARCFRGSNARFWHMPPGFCGVFTRAGSDICTLEVFVLFQNKREVGDVQ